jgi:hypothetical protein
MLSSYYYNSKPVAPVTQSYSCAHVPSSLQLTHTHTHTVCVYTYTASTHIHTAYTHLTHMPTNIHENAHTHAHAHTYTHACTARHDKSSETLAEVSVMFLNITAPL